MNNMQTRFSGVLCHPTSFPSPYGVGDFGKGSYNFIDFLEKSGQTIWQLLPLGHTGFGDSPYQSFSSFAGQPLLISPDKLCDIGLLTDEDCIPFPCTDNRHVDYGPVIEFKHSLYKKAFHNFCTSKNLNLINEFNDFCEKESEWLDDYSLFMTGKDIHDGRCWLEWEDELRSPTPEIKLKWSIKFQNEINYYKFLQFIFFKQWFELKQYANDKNISIIGDIPIFVSPDSADVWSNRKLFKLDSKGFPTVVAGVPPDYFSATGQLWGNPLYDWAYHKSQKYRWWIKRIDKQLTLVDFIRIDHFRGFEAYYEIPYGAKTAIKGKWTKGPDADLFNAIKTHLGENLPIFAEDLGIITPEVEKLRDDFKLPGMKVLQFGFDSLEDSDMIPLNYTTPNIICYTGTHDNDTTVGWYNTASEQVRDKVRRYLNTDANRISWDFIRCAMSSIAKYSIYPIQDILGFGSDCRMNTPSTPSGNWQFRFYNSELTDDIANQLLEMTQLYGRNIPKPESKPEDNSNPNTELIIDAKVNIHYQTK